MNDAGVGMASRPKSTPSLQSVLDTYHYLVRGFRRDADTPPAHHAARMAREIVVPAVVRRDMAATLRTMPPELGVVGLSSGSVRVNGNVFLLSDRYVPFAHVEDANLLAFSIHEAGDHTAAVHESRHRWLYAHSPAQAIVMVHPTAAIACAVRGIVPNPSYFPAASAIYDVQPVLSDPATWLPTDSNAATYLVRDGTVLACDATLREAIARAAVVARWCEVYLLTRDHTITGNGFAP